MLWRQIRDLRNVLVHVYHGVDLDRIWHVVEQDLPLLAEQLRDLLETEGSG